MQIYILNYFSRKCNLFFYIIGEWILKKINSFIIFNKHKSYILYVPLGIQFISNLNKNYANFPSEFISLSLFKRGRLNHRIKDFTDEAHKILR